MKKLRSSGNDDDDNNGKVSDYFIQPIFAKRQLCSPTSSIYIHKHLQFFSSPLREKHGTVIPFFLDMEAENKEVKS